MLPAEKVVWSKLMYTPGSTPICCACFNFLKPKERKSFFTKCTKCYEDFRARWDRWKRGHPDAELDRLMLRGL